LKRGESLSLGASTFEAQKIISRLSRGRTKRTAWQLTVLARKIIHARRSLAQSILNSDDADVEPRLSKKARKRLRAQQADDAAVAANSVAAAADDGDGGNVVVDDDDVDDSDGDDANIGNDDKDIDDDDEEDDDGEMIPGGPDDTLEDRDCAYVGGDWKRILTGERAAASTASSPSFKDSYAQASALFQWLIYPTSISTFFEDYFEKKPLIIHRRYVSFCSLPSTALSTNVASRGTSIVNTQLCSHHLRQRCEVEEADEG
jgi:hypothetical protein